MINVAPLYSLAFLSLFDIVNQWISCVALFCLIKFHGHDYSKTYSLNLIMNTCQH